MAELEKNSWQKFENKFWFLRGFIAATSLSALIPEITDLSRFEFLRIFHALVVGWNIWMGAIGDLIGRLPLIQPLPPSTINSLIILGMLIPALMGFWDYLATVHKKMKDRSNSNFFQKSVSFCVGTYIRFLELILNFLTYILESGRYFVYFAFLFFIVYPISANKIESTTSTLLDSEFVIIWPVLLFLPFLVLIIACVPMFILMVIVGVGHFKPYRNGIFLFLTFILTFEVFYLLEFGVISDFLNNFADQVLGPREDTD